MNLISSFREALGAFVRLPHVPRARRPLALGAIVGAFALAAIPAMAPPPMPTQAALYQVFLNNNAQKLTVSDAVSVSSVTRDEYSATPGIQTLAAGGTNHDWAKLVLVLAGLPMTESNVTVFTRWMRQENGTNDWWNRNNPLNNGWGSGGGGGLGSYSTLVVAAENAADALKRNAGYSGIVAAFAASAPTAEIERAIWNSSWATGHYAFGGHWSSAPVPVVKSPDGTW